MQLLGLFLCAAALGYVYVQNKKLFEKGDER